MAKRASPSIRFIFCLVFALILPTGVVSGKFLAITEPAPEKTQNLSATVSVSINTAGFDPAIVSIEENDSVTWTNLTSNPVTLVEGLVYEIYIPLVVKGSAAGSPLITPPPVLPAPGDKITILPGESYTRAFPAGGVYHFYLAGNMNATCTVTVNAITPLPDLETQSITLNPNPVAANSTTTLTTRINNLGSGAAGAFSVSWAVIQQGQSNPSASGTWPVTDLAAGGYLDLTTPVTLSQAGLYTVQVIADSTAALAETSKANNTKQVDLNVSGVIDVCGDITSDTTWAYSTYVLTCKINVLSGATLTINQGAIVKSGPGDYWSGTTTGLDISGRLIATGASGQPVVFTSIYDDSYGGDTNNDGTATTPAPGNWTQIVIRSGGAASFDQALIRYAGGTIYASTQQSIQNDAGTLSFTNSILEYGGGVGVRSITNGAIDIQNSTIRNQSGHGVVYSSNGASAPTILNTTFQSNSGYAIYLDPSGNITLDGARLANNTASGNTTNGMRLSGDFTGASTLSGNLGFPYVLEQRAEKHSVTVLAGATLNIQSSAVLKGQPGGYWNGYPTGLDVSGQLIVAGTAAQPVIFTSITDDSYGGDTNNDGAATSPAAGDWSQITIRAGGTATFDQALIRYAGGGLYGSPQQSIYNIAGALILKNSALEYSGGVGVRSISNGLIDIQNSAVRNNNSHGVVYSSSGASAPTILNTTFQSNNGYAIYLDPSGNITLDGARLANNTASGNTTNGMRLSGDFTGVSTLSGNLGFPYVLEQRAEKHSVTILAGSTLNIQSGAVLKGQPGGYWNGYPTGLDVSGQLIVAGTAAQPVIFTSITDDSYGGDTNNDGAGSSPAAGDWSQITIRAGGTATFDQALIRYAGGGLYGSPQQSIYNSGNIVLIHTTISNSGGVGIRNAGGTLNVQASAFIANPTGISIDTIGNTGSASISGCIFEGNTSWGIYNPSGITIQAANNWWGNASGPTHSSNPSGAGDPVSDNVIFSPFLTTRPW